MIVKARVAFESRFIFKSVPPVANSTTWVDKGRLLGHFIGNKKAISQENATSLEWISYLLSALINLCVYGSNTYF